VSGDHLVDSGKVVVLHGVGRSGTEYQCVNGNGIFDGPDVTNDDSQPPLIASWHANSEFIGLNEDCWLGINGVNSAYALANYQSVIEHYVKTIEANGLYPVIGLFIEAPGTTLSSADGTHPGDPMPDNDHAPLFWEEVADAFKNDPNVIFRLKEEPYPNNANSSLATWQCWSQGDVSYSTTSDNTPPTPPTATGTPGKCAGMVNDFRTGAAYQAVGMQSLINIIRGTGARNVIQVPGVAYANMLACSTTTSPVSCGFLDSADGVRVSDPLNPSQLMADVDVYPDFNECGSQGDTSCYDDTYAPVVQVMPLDAGETGTFTGNTTLFDRFLSWMDSQHQSYYAWAWDSWSTLISDYNGTAKAPVGTDYKAHLAGG
jgi:endoglucanase